MSSEKSEYLQTAIRAAELAAAIIQSYAGSGCSSETKVVDNTELGLVTKADLEAEACIVDAIKSVFPSHSFLAEESHAKASDAEHLWVIDPLDGTNNFAHSIPHYSVSIAYYQNQVAKCGVVKNPATGECFWAEQGRGAWLGNSQVSVSRQTQLRESIIATGFYYDRGQMMKETLNTINDLFEQNIRGIRRFGSAALDLAYVGCGRFSGYFEYQLFPWDFGAGKLFVEEAGGIVTNCFGESVQLQPTTMLAANSHIHSQILNVIAKHVTQTNEWPV